MKNKLSVLLIILTMSGFMATAARAGGGGPPPHPFHHHGFGGPGFFPGINLVIATGNSAPDPGVTLVGHVFRQVGDSTYLFTDGTNTYQLDSDDTKLPIGAQIVVGGRYSGDAEIDVHRWHYVE